MKTAILTLWDRILDDLADRIADRLAPIDDDEPSQKNSPQLDDRYTDFERALILQQRIGQANAHIMDKTLSDPNA